MSLMITKVNIIVVFEHHAKARYGGRGSTYPQLLPAPLNDIECPAWCYSSLRQMMGHTLHVV